jgi:hypothetical protein
MQNFGGEAFINPPFVRLKKGWENYLKMNLREIRCEDGRWMELAQDRVQWQALVLAVREICCEDGRWMELAQDRVQWRTSVLAVLKFLVLLPES